MVPGGSFEESLHVVLGAEAISLPYPHIQRKKGKRLNKRRKKNKQDEKFSQLRFTFTLTNILMEAVEL